jgi:hypothetical protein
VRLDGLLRRAALWLAQARSGSALAVHSRVRALRGALGLMLLRRKLPGALDALGAGRVAPHVCDPRSDRVLESLSRLPTSCLWRALAGFAALRARGDPVRFVLGVRAEGGDVLAHAWLERDGAPLAQARDPRASFQVAFSYPTLTPREERSMTSPSDVILTELEDGTGVLLHLGTKFYYVLNRTGVAVWKSLGAGVADPGELARGIVAAFEGVTEEQARADVVSLLSELRAEGLAPGT